MSKIPVSWFLGAWPVRLCLFAPGQHLHRVPRSQSSPGPDDTISRPNPLLGRTGKLMRDEPASAYAPDISQQIPLR